MGDFMIKDMFKKTYKTFIIIILTLSAIYLTGQLWFVEIAGRDIGYVMSSFFPNNRIDIEDIRTGMLATPFRIIAGNEDNIYTIIYNNLDASEQKRVADELIFEVLTNGTFVSSFPIDYSELLHGNVYIYEFAVRLPSDAFARSFGLRSGIISSRVDEFDKIVLKQNSIDRSAISVIIVNTDIGECFEFVYRDAALTALFNNSFDNISNSKHQITYISSVQEGYTMFNTNVFIPVWEGDYFLYNMVIPENPYLENGLLHLNTIADRVSMFFDRPASKWSGLQNNVFTFSQGNTVVKYHPNNVLEYSYYGALSQGASPSFESDFYIALNFIYRDAMVTGEFYLDAHRSNATQSIFYFSYAINDFPVKLSTIIMSETGMSHAIEVTVENGIVRRYRKLAVSFNQETIIQGYANISFDDHIGLFAADYGDQRILLDNVSLAYILDRRNELPLHWFSIMEGTPHSQPARFRY
ncbi:MAG: hypothetical protein FWE29_04260 [Defluviitaleaceae bacterium]|nr:hypothetical protein [Defluviitaleaceae bacterium]